MTHSLFGDDVSPPTDAPGFMFGNCWLYVCTGNEPEEFAFGYQEELAGYVSLLGYHPLLLVSPRRTRERYDGHFAAWRQGMRAVAAATRLELPVLAPWCLDHDPAEQQFQFETAWPVPSVLAGSSNGPLTGDLLEHLDAIRYNQLAPIHARSLARFAALPWRAPWRTMLSAMQARVAAVMRFYNKAEYVALLHGRGTGAELPPHVSTAVMTEAELPATWDELQRRMSWSDEITGCVIKSDRDACGDVMVVAEREDYERELVELRRQIAGKAEHRNRPVDLRFLVQERLVPPSGATNPHGVPSRFGLNLYVHGPARVDFVCASQQLYADPRRTIHLGSYCSRAIDDAVSTELGLERLRAMGRLFARDGYVGPIGFDGMLDARGRAQLIYDCNPRMTGVLPVLAVRRLLEAQGVEVEAVGNAGYHGAIRASHDVCGWLDELGLLFVRGAREQGVLPLPSFASADGTRFDILFVNLELPRILAVVDELHEAGIVGLAELYP